MCKQVNVLEIQGSISRWDDLKNNGIMDGFFSKVTKRLISDDLQHLTTQISLFYRTDLKNLSKNVQPTHLNINNALFKAKHTKTPSVMALNKVETYPLVFLSSPSG